MDDTHVPCKELALQFNKGDILHITDRTDENWWQAFRDGETGVTLAGLIPSSNFEKLRQQSTSFFIKSSFIRMQTNFFCEKLSCLQNIIAKNDEEDASSTPKTFCRKKFLKKKKKKKDAEKTQEKFYTYEEMALYSQPESVKRPIILIGAQCTMRNEFRQRFLDEEKHRFTAAVPHTTRPMMEGEVNGRDYYFVQRDVFMNDIKEFKFIEHGNDGKKH